MTTSHYCVITTYWQISSTCLISMLYIYLLSNWYFTSICDYDWTWHWTFAVGSIPYGYNMHCYCRSLVIVLSNKNWMTQKLLWAGAHWSYNIIEVILVSVCYISAYGCLTAESPHSLYWPQLERQHRMKISHSGDLVCSYILLVGSCVAEQNFHSHIVRRCTWSPI